MADKNCTVCGAEPKLRPGGGLPTRPQWRNAGGKVFCHKCFKAKYRLLSVTLPVAGPLGFYKDLREAKGVLADPKLSAGNPTRAGSLWDEFRTRLRQAWGMSTALANWGVTHLTALDPPRHPGQDRLPRMPSVQMYDEMNRHYPGRSAWDGCTASARCLLATLVKYWSEERLDTLWHFLRSTRTYTWPFPFPVGPEGWEVHKTAHGERRAALHMPGGPVIVRVRNDDSWRRQLYRFDEVVSGAAVPGEAAVYAKGVRGPDDRNGVLIRGPRGRQEFRVMLKLVAYFPRIERKGLEGDMTVMTAADRLFRAVWGSGGPDETWDLFADDVRTRVIGHLVRLERLRPDIKAERRAPVEVSRRSHIDLAHETERYKAWNDTRVDQLTAMVAGLAGRRGVATLTYDDTVQTWIPQWPWYRMRKQLERKVTDLGIRFVYRGDPASGEAENSPTDQTE